MHGTPTVAYRAAGGTRESVAHGRSGLLVDTPAEFTAALRTVLTDPGLRGQLAAGARRYSRQFTWEHSQAAFAHVVAAATLGRTISAQDEIGSDHSVEP